MWTHSFALLWFVGCVVNMVRAQQGPNFIVFQPDDYVFFEEWTPPAHLPQRPESFSFPAAGLPNVERLRGQGLQMKQAHTASPMCGTSRYSTVTGKYPSRSSYGRDRNLNEDIPGVSIPTTKLEDFDTIQDGYDCRDNNLAALMSENDYHTGVVGKWHLSRIDNGSYNYTEFLEEIRACGFDYAESIYAENMGGFWHDGTFSHNMEYLTHKALEFMDEARDLDKRFFLYFNPTVPHGSGNVYDALTLFNCTDTVDGDIGTLPGIPGMTEGTTCDFYRETVIDRAGSTQNKLLGAVWVDDAIGALLQNLEDNDQINNTFFLFQIDHGQEGKGSIYETGTRIAQFIHFPDEFGTAGIEFNGIVSTIDIGPTIIDYAGITDQSDGYYEMDGSSWRPAIEDANVASTWKTDRCLAFELEKARAIKCGKCDKYISIPDTSNSGTATFGSRRGLAVDNELFFDLCDQNGDYITSGSTSPETTDVKDSNPSKLADMQTLWECHLAKTKPSWPPEYIECSNSFTPFPTAAPTTTPSMAPSACVDDPDYSFERNGTPRTCEWVGNRANRCELDNYGRNCPATCGHCTP